MLVFAQKKLLVPAATAKAAHEVAACEKSAEAEQALSVVFSLQIPDKGEQPTKRKIVRKIVNLNLEPLGLNTEQGSHQVFTNLKRGESCKQEINIEVA